VQVSQTRNIGTQNKTLTGYDEAKKNKKTNPQSSFMSAATVGIRLGCEQCKILFNRAVLWIRIQRLWPDSKPNPKKGSDSDLDSDTVLK
jgi:hypothetical protein